MFNVTSGSGNRLPIDYPSDKIITNKLTQDSQELPPASQMGMAPSTSVTLTIDNSIPLKGLEPDFLEHQGIRIDADTEDCEEAANKATFKAKAFTAVTSGVTLATSVATTWATGTGAVVLAANAAAAALSFADLTCITHDVLDGKKPAAERSGALASGSDALISGIHFLAGKCGYSPEKSMEIAAYSGMAVRTSITSAPAVLANFIPATAPGFMTTVNRIMSTIKPAIDLNVNKWGTDNAMTSTRKQVLIAQKRQNEFVKLHGKALHRPVTESMATQTTAPVREAIGTQTETQLRKRSVHTPDNKQ
ncbi:hypothetical protein [Winslowiella iniecta]|uniref:Uncharacterized protein n=1 Tax=Winslowiella iniecta TaxID=1560201 RepID=A0A0L7TCN7_9GAMM|nr:hypothetical protein [Winslowiella iniecta]KOC90708.1 hypothetical protein NG42_08370 [Winslowiella iniecta]KOC93132.1 hypothetical protein NG43_12225 [Winslowiella iniecta]